MRKSGILFVPSLVVTAFFLLAWSGCQSQAATTRTAGGTANVEQKSGPELESWSLKVDTAGGITGRGIGGIVIQSNGAATTTDPACTGTPSKDQLENLAQTIRYANPASWRPSYVREQNPKGYADQIEYTVTLTTQPKGQPASTHSAKWYDENEMQIPGELRTLREESWKLRSNVLDKCKPSGA
ncbi:MAG: hypothetical protein WBX15_07280 [Thermoanaerobaculia bacterium]